ncbi:MAG TPA: DUF1614 domain-containing protein [candidate division WOR-3 bacterium]|uniref:DUF1614 domain-containing protein n=2 Tax=candidate division WOR-3 bacterium TaxID=2052148 RepID=A0A7C0VAR4_UNCW3|nr:DUF1614 domain-containing protein [candidate division WOR-3 bacterium]
MFFLPVSIILIILFILLLPFLLFLLQLGIISIAFSNLGLSTGTGILFFILCLIGSGINIPVYRRYVEDSGAFPPYVARMLGFPAGISEQIIAINVGGAILPVLLSLYLLRFVPFNIFLISTLIVTVVTYVIARPVKGIGITMPALIPPVVSALVAILLFRENPAPLAYSAGVIGTLIGADILHLHHLQRMGRGVMSIGGAGVFDGIFLVGIISALLT